jgi:ribosome-associated protein
VNLITTHAPEAADMAAATAPGGETSAAGPLVKAILSVLDDAKAEEIISLDLAGKTSLADAMIIASGRSDRHVGAIAERVASALRDLRLPTPRIEGMPVCDWVLIDAGDVLVHLFRPEVRGFYNLEKLWGMGRPSEGAAEDKPKLEKSSAGMAKPAKSGASTAKPATKPRPRVIRTRTRAE